MELKPCPFCGNEVKFVSGTATIKCTVCACAYIVTNPCISRYEVALGWNTRTFTKIEHNSLCETETYEGRGVYERKVSDT